jgi:hypothetical protein
MQQTFDKQDLLPDVLSLAYGKWLAGVLMELGGMMADAGITAALLRGGSSVDWAEHPEARGKAITAGLGRLVRIEKEGGNNAR